MNVGFLPVALLPFVFGMGVMFVVFRQARFEKELEHAQRLKALELGRTLPGDAPFWTLSKVALAIGVLVPLGTCALAYAVSLEDVILARYAWPAAGAIGVAGVICGTILAARNESDKASAAKPSAWEPDSLDTSGPRAWVETSSRGCRN